MKKLLGSEPKGEGRGEKMTKKKYPNANAAFLRA